LAGETFLLNSLEESLAFLRQSEEIAESATGIEAATSWEWQGIVAWMFALVYQTSHAPKTAYERAKHAVECYRNAGLLSSLPRAELFAAVCGMDWAARQLYDRVIPDVLTDVATLISDARLRLVTLRTADSDFGHSVASDKEGDALGNLAYLRYQRLAGQGSHEQRLAELYALIEHVKLIGDQALIGQAYLTCGDELAHGGQSKQACENYDKAIKHLRKVAPLLIARAERGIANGGHIPSDMV